MHGIVYNAVAIECALGAVGGTANAQLTKGLRNHLTCVYVQTKSIHCARLERRRIEGSRDANARVHEKRLRELVENLKPSKHQSK